jgi:hypothetical protein
MWNVLHFLLFPLVLKGCDKTIEPFRAQESAVNVRKLLFVVIQQTAGQAGKKWCVTGVKNSHAIYCTALLRTENIAAITGLKRGQNVTHFIKPRWIGARTFCQHDLRRELSQK